VGRASCEASLVHVARNPAGVDRAEQRPVCCRPGTQARHLGTRHAVRGALGLPGWSAHEGRGPGPLRAFGRCWPPRGKA
jgi:hypothetical protein